jgi:hypothetical protein
MKPAENESSCDNAMALPPWLLWFLSMARG